MIDDGLFAVEEVRVNRLAFIIRLSGHRQRQRFEWANHHTGAFRDAAMQAVIDKITDTIDRWAKRHVRRRGHVPVDQHATIADGRGEYDELFGDPDARRLRVSIRAIPDDAVPAELRDRDIMVPDDEYVVRVAVAREK